MDARRVTFVSHRGHTLGPFVISAYQYNANLARKQTRGPDGESSYEYRTGDVQFTDVNERIHRLDLDSIMHTMVEKVTVSGPE